MKRTLSLVAVFGLTALAACVPPPSSSDRQRDAQEKMVAEGVSQVGLPAIKNFRELKIAKDIYELRDQTSLTTYTYTFSEVTGKLSFFCDSIGYPIPYAVQFTAPESVQRYSLPGAEHVERVWGHEKLAQPEPNGLFSPASAEGTWIMCKDSKGKDAKPVYSEPKLIVSQLKLKSD